MKFSYNVSLDLFGVQMVTAESKPTVHLDWYPVNRKKNLELFLIYKLQKSWIFLTL